jgi:hypothetical protein
VGSLCDDVSGVDMLLARVGAGEAMQMSKECEMLWVHIWGVRAGQMFTLCMALQLCNVICMAIVGMWSLQHTFTAF